VYATMTSFFAILTHNSVLRLIQINLHSIQILSVVLFLCAVVIIDSSDIFMPYIPVNAGLKLILYIIIFKIRRKNYKWKYNYITCIFTNLMFFNDVLYFFMWIWIIV
jgi:hypothetical protein